MGLSLVLLTDGGGRRGQGVGEQNDPLPKICHTCPTMIKLWHSYILPKEDLKTV